MSFLDLENSSTGSVWIILISHYQYYGGSVCFVVFVNWFVDCGNTEIISISLELNVTTDQALLSFFLVLY